MVRSSIIAAATETAGVGGALPAEKSRGGHGSAGSFQRTPIERGSQMSQRRILQRTIVPRQGGPEPARSPRISLFCWHAPENGADRPPAPTERVAPRRSRTLDDRRRR